jgi:hypothetical protein
MSCPQCSDELFEELTSGDVAGPEADAGVPVQEPSLSAPPPYSLPTPVKQTYGFVVLGLALFAFGVLTGYLIRGPQPVSGTGYQAQAETTGPHAGGDAGESLRLIDTINPSTGYTIPAIFGDVGPQMLAAGAIDYNQFSRVYEQAGQPLTDAQQSILTRGSDESVHINQENAYYLLNFFWALGLVNDNPLLTEGPLVEYSEGRIERFAATGGWTIGQKPPAELIASAAILHLNHEQQERLEEVAYNAFRPCCNNHTAFPDCNHGMALLGLLQLMAAQDATVEEMFDAAKYVNAFWFPEQTLQMAAFFQLNQGLAFAEVDPRLLVGPQISSAAGYRNVQEWLAQNGGLQQSPGGGGGCGV